MSSDLELMQSIKTKWGDAIAAAADQTIGIGTVASSFQPAFYAALIANESGGDANAKRFEKGVLISLWEVLLGRKAAYGSIGRADLVAYVAGFAAIPPNAPANLPADAFQRVDALATSWGLTQIMGYHVFDREINIGGPALPMWLNNLKNGNALVVTTRMLAQFAQRFQLDPAKDVEQLFRCWNTGQPDGATFDPQYALTGMTRMAIWTSL